MRHPQGIETFSVRRSEHPAMASPRSRITFLQKFFGGPTDVFAVSKEGPLLHVVLRVSNRSIRFTHNAQFLFEEDGDIDVAVTWADGEAKLHLNKEVVDTAPFPATTE